MTGLRIAVIVIGLVIAAPVIALNVWGINMSLWINEMTAQNESVLNGETNVSVLRNMTSSPMAWLRGRADLAEVFATDEITDARSVTVAQILRIDDLFVAGETAPSEVFVPLYAAARAPARLSTLCEDVIASIGTACELVHSEVRRTRLGNVELVGRLAFIPAAPLGDPATVNDGALLRASIPLPFTGELRPANDAQTRRALMLQAQGICDQLRDRFGNCVLGRLSLDVRELWITDLEVLPEGTNPQRIDATASFIVYADNTVMDSSSLRDVLTELVDPG